jgi:hypothetical protein
MRVRLGKRTLNLLDRDLIGQGGEACVYRAKDRAVKIYHPLPDQVLAARIAKIRSFPKDLPAAVLAPEEIAERTDGVPIGFSMPLVEAAFPIAKLAQRRFREGHIPCPDVLRVFRALRAVVIELHQRGVVIGDLNDGNILVKDLLPFVIDADSLQLPNHPCPVAHPNFLDPRVYGIDLFQRPALSEESDWYAFAVLLFSSLVYLHPFGGVHPGYPTMLRRAEARVSVLRPEVTRPKSAADPHILPADLLACFERIFEKDERGPFPEALLEIPFVRCSCGLEHARPLCPACGGKGVVKTIERVIRCGRCRVVSIVRTRGRIVHAVMQGNLRYLIEEDRVLKREDGQRVIAGAERSGRAQISGRSTFVDLNGQIVEVKDEKAAARLSTRTFFGESMFAASASALLRFEDQWLVCEPSGIRLGSVLEDQTWIACGESLAYGFYRAGRITVHFLARLDRPGLTNLELPPIAGRLLDVHAVFDDGHALVAWHSEENGRRRAELWLVDRTGRPIAGLAGAPDSSPLLASPRGKALFGGHIVVATDRGLASVRIDRTHKTLSLGDLFADTEPFLSEESELLPGPNGSVYVVNSNEILQLVLE